MLSSRSLPHLLVAAILACATTASCAQSTGQLPRADDFATLAKEARTRRVPVMIAFVQPAVEAGLIKLRAAPDQRENSRTTCC
ncbi:MAG: hypothetical protein OEP48_02015 [Betaproteobacteria bacterium]|nr:hypothetical protein [Betaproteobacteria bacterium]MDH3436318.1 hypothetical protein [Betaproteobacteria bacterium]